MMLVSVGRSTIAVNPPIHFYRAMVRSSGLFDDMVVRSRGVKLTCYIEKHRGLVGNIIIRLYNGAFAGLIYSLLVLTD